MALTTCSVTTSVIAALGTTPDERGLTTDQFKAKFDEAPSALKDFFNNTTKPEVDAHLASKTPHDVPMARVYNSTNQSINSASETVLAFNSESFDTDNMHDNSTANSRLTIQTAGKYIVAAGVAFASDATGLRRLYIKVNGSVNDAAVNTNAVNGDSTYLNALMVRQFNVADYIEASVYQSSSGALNVVSGVRTFLSAVKVG
jgi:hypothetical protein